MEHGDIILFRLLGGGDLHFVGNGAGEEDHQVGIADLFLHGPVFFWEHLGFVALFLADFLVATYHAFITADDDDTHILTFLSELVKTNRGFENKADPKWVSYD